jgi:hypothetical protein
LEIEHAFTGRTVIEFRAALKSGVRGIKTLTALAIFTLSRPLQHHHDSELDDFRVLINSGGITCGFIRKAVVSLAALIVFLACIFK